METCLNPTINTNIHTLFSIRLQQGGTAANIHLNCPKGSTRLFSTIQTLKFLERLLKLWRLKTSPTFLMENKVWHHHLNFLFFFPAEPQIQETWGKKKKAEAGRNVFWDRWTDATTNEKRQKTVYVKSSLSLQGTKVRGSVYTAGTVNSSLSDPSQTPRPHAALQTHGEETRPSSWLSGDKFRQHFQHSKNSEQ